jgi:hypothetical protein
LYVRNQRVLFAFPTNDSHCGLFVAWPAAELPVVRKDIEGQFMAVVDRVPELAGRREERFSGATDLPNFFRKPYVQDGRWSALPAATRTRSRPRRVRRLPRCGASRGRA